MRKTLGVCLLVLLLTGSASAGIIPNLSPANGEIPNDARAAGIIPNDAPDSLTQTLLDLLALLPF
jgi:hypothetical protein